MPNEDKTVVLKEGEVVVDQKTLVAIQEQMAGMEKKLADEAAARAGLEEIVQAQAEADASGKPKIRERKNFEPQFRTVRIRKFPIAGDVTNLGYVVGWTSRGAYQEVDRTGVSPQVVDFLDVIFLNHERNGEGKLQAEKVKLLDFLNKSEPVHCKIVKIDRRDEKVPTGEEIDVRTFDPAHGLVDTGEKIDGYVMVSEISYTVQIPGIAEPVVIDGRYLN